MRENNDIPGQDITLGCSTILYRSGDIGRLIGVQAGQPKGMMARKKAVITTGMDQPSSITVLDEDGKGGRVAKEWFGEWMEWPVCAKRETSWERVV